MRNFILLLLCVVSCNDIGAQTLDFTRMGKVAKSDTIMKEIVDKAKYIATYKYRYAKDASFPNEKRKGLTVLQIGDKYNRFVDYYRLRYDSLLDVTAKGQLSMANMGPKMISALKKEKYEEAIILDKQKNKEVIQRNLMAKKYQYEEDAPNLKWDLLEGDTIIAGYNCNKAKTTLFGRDYVAWYSLEVNMPYGPYKFNGLPGLVFKVTDTKDNFEFTLLGLEKVVGNAPIYKWTAADIIKSSRDKVRKIYKNYCADPTIALNGMEGVTISDEVKATVKSKPYNPIELE